MFVYFPRAGSRLSPVRRSDFADIASFAGPTRNVYNDTRTQVLPVSKVSCRFVAPVSSVTHDRRPRCVGAQRLDVPSLAPHAFTILPRWQQRDLFFPRGGVLGF